MSNVQCLLKCAILHHHHGLLRVCQIVHQDFSISALWWRTFWNHQHFFWRVAYWNLLFTSWGWVCVIFLNNAETQAACSKAFKLISCFFFQGMSSLLHSWQVQLYIFKWLHTNNCQTIQTEKIFVSVSKWTWKSTSVRMFVGVAQVIICAFVLFPVLEHPLSMSHPNVNSLLFVTL